ncbi:hypothetical protein T01_15652 [Trichinella spiralis]|uniref:Uncharacterized protein n=1 Tax=Trichinella spiralis TaxID=6334 RepID=A0A0V1BKB3_TRISP|nr:hypothetical protein T01_15652 [Trichinella spiralis]
METEVDPLVNLSSMLVWISFQRLIFRNTFAHQNRASIYQFDFIYISQPLESEILRYYESVKRFVQIIHFHFAIAFIFPESWLSLLMTKVQSNECFISNSLFLDLKSIVHYLLQYEL